MNDYILNCVQIYKGLSIYIDKICVLYKQYECNIQEPGTLVIGPKPVELIF